MSGLKIVKVNRNETASNARSTKRKLANRRVGTSAGESVSGLKIARVNRKKTAPVAESTKCRVDEMHTRRSYLETTC